MRNESLRRAAILAATVLFLDWSNGIKTAARDLIEPVVQNEARLTLESRLVEGERRTYRLVAQINGGQDNDRDLYCQPVTWGFGDGPPLTVTPMCAPWTSEVKIQRRFETLHTYERPGTYEVTFSYGALTARQQLRVE
jgi:hypothetical protein